MADAAPNRGERFERGASAGRAPRYEIQETAASFGLDDFGVNDRG